MSQLANAFIYKNKVYIRAIPVKSLFRSNMIHDVVSRGDIFAVELSTGKLTVLDGKEPVEAVEIKHIVQLELDLAK